MQSRDFFYWLQGHFELALANDPMNAQQAACVLKHIELIANPGERVIEIRAIVRMIGRGLGVEQLTADVRDIVAAEFLHVIDPQDGDATKQAELNKIHGQNPHLFKPGVTTPGGGVARC